jgi:hypothetical protein
MRGPIDGLLQEAASVYRLVQFIERFCVEQKASRSYVPATSRFLGMARLLADRTKRHLQETAAEGVRRAAAKSSFTDTWLNNERDSLHTIKCEWTILHRYLKPAADAHALQVPFSLVTLAERQLRSLEQMGGALIAVLVTPELNYFQRSHTSLKNTICTLGEATGQKDIPTGLVGFVELPFSQGPSLFSNVLMYHELGHFILAERTAVAGALRKAASDSLSQVYGKELTANPKSDQFFTRMLENWAFEIFCDLFAIRLIGPAFTFASVEMFGLVGVLAGDTPERFVQSHPAPACRFQQQLAMLKDDGWWQSVALLDSDRRVQIERLAEVPKDRYWLSLDGKRAQRTDILAAFDTLLGTVWKCVREVTNDPSDARQCFADESADVQACLAEGVVPSRLFSARPLSLAMPVAIINAAFCFYLSEQLPSLITALADQDATDLEHRSYWIKRLEMWTVKAIEDFFLLEGAQQYGRSTTGGTAIKTVKGS